MFRVLAQFLRRHVETWSWCQAFVRFECWDEHDANNPQHQEGTPTGDLKFRSRDP